MKVTDITRVFTADELSGEGVILKKGKKVYHRALLG